jgi:hypothetical protein
MTTITITTSMTTNTMSIIMSIIMGMTPIILVGMITITDTAIRRNSKCLTDTIIRAKITNAEKPECLLVR